MNDLFELILDDATPDVPAILPLYGGAAKPIEAMTAEEFDVAAEQVYVKVRESAFSRGMPVIIERNGRAFREFADGHFEPIA